MLSPAPFFNFPLQEFSQNAQPSHNAGMILGDWGFAPTSKIRLGSTQTLLAATYFSNILQLLVILTASVENTTTACYNITKDNLLKTIVRSSVMKVNNKKLW